MSYRKIETSFSYGEKVNLTEEVGKVFEAVLDGVRKVSTPGGLSDTAIAADFTGLDGKKYSTFLPAQLVQIFTYVNPETDEIIIFPEFEGQRVRIEYTGKIKAKRGRMNSFDVQVWEDD